jgi:alpha-D-ribose 1-methylphosphonate 5-triphosphate synthase subunit PhnL
MAAAVSVRGLTKRFTHHLRGGARTTVLDGANLEVDAGQVVAITGPSGSGKSSLLRCVYRTYRPDAGSVVLSSGGESVDLVAASDRTVLDARRRLVGLVAQFLHVVPRVAAADLVAAEGCGREEAAGLLGRLGLSPARALDPPATFSGGERQIVGLAMALARPRPFLLLDEPTASLDPARRALALGELARRKEEGTTMLAVFHDVPREGGLVDRVVAVRDGKVVPA